MNNLKGRTRALLSTAFQLFGISMCCGNNETDALSISIVHGSAYRCPMDFLFDHGFTDSRRFTLKKNGGVRLRMIVTVVLVENHWESSGSYSLSFKKSRPNPWTTASAMDVDQNYVRQFECQGMGQYGRTGRETHHPAPGGFLRDPSPSDRTNDRTKERSK